MDNLPKEPNIISDIPSKMPQICVLKPILAPKKPKKAQTCPICLKTVIFPLNAKKYCSKECTLIASKLYRHKHYLNHRQHYLDLARQHRRLNPYYMKKYWESHKLQRKINARNRRLRLKKEKTILNKKIARNLRSRIREALKGKNKSAHTLKLIGCSIEQLKNHIESKFKLDMSWKNYGLWHIDHIKPCASFDLRNPEEQYKCFNYTNLQPLWAEDNLKKGIKYDPS